MRAIGQHHFYCSAAAYDNAWIIHECRCKARDIDGRWFYRVKSRHYAYKLAKLLNLIYRFAPDYLKIVRHTLPIVCVKDYEQALRMCEGILIFLREHK